LRYTFDRRERLFVAKLILIAATSLAVLFSIQWALIRIRTGGDFEWKLLLNAFSLTYSWVAIFPLILWLDYLFPIQRKKVVRSILVQAFLSICVNALIILVNYSIDWLIRFGDQPGWMGASSKLREVLPNYFINRTTTNLIYYWAILGVGEAINYFRKYRDREVRLTEAQVQILKSQLNPHFLFNTLNAISELVYDHPKKADAALTQLSYLLRLSLQSDRTQEVALKEELEFLQAYMEIQQTLMQERLSFDSTIDPLTLDALVPSMLLQPLVENAIRHGIAPRAVGGKIELEVCRNNGAVKIHIRDNGLGLKGKGTESSSQIGLKNTRARLQHLYGDAHHFELSETPGGGVTVDMVIPFRERAVSE